MIPVGQPAPVFRIESVQGSVIDLAQYQGRQAVLLWFSRGFTCPFCRGYLAQLQSGYTQFREAQVEILQIAPNLLLRARQFFRTYPLTFPFLCDPEKRLYQLYGLDDHGPVVGTRNTLISFTHAYTHGSGVETTRASAMDVFDRSFIQRMHHHAFTAVEQGLFLINASGLVCWNLRLRPLENLPDNERLLGVVNDVLKGVA